MGPVGRERRGSDQVEHRDRAGQRRAPRGQAQQVGDVDGAVELHLGARGESPQQRHVDPAAPFSLEHVGGHLEQVPEPDSFDRHQLLGAGGTQGRRKPGQRHGGVGQAVVAEAVQLKRVLEHRVQTGRAGVRGVAGIDPDGVRTEPEAGVRRGAGQRRTSGTAAAADEAEVDRRPRGHQDGVGYVPRRRRERIAVDRDRRTVGIEADQGRLDGRRIAHGAVVIAVGALGQGHGEALSAAASPTRSRGGAAIQQPDQVQGDRVGEGLHVAP